MYGQHFCRWCWIARGLTDCPLPEARSANRAMSSDVAGHTTCDGRRKHGRFIPFSLESLWSSATSSGEWDKHWGVRHNRDIHLETRIHEARVSDVPKSVSHLSGSPEENSSSRRRTEASEKGNMETNTTRQSPRACCPRWASSRGREGLP